MTVFVGPSIWREMNVVTATRMMVAMQSAPQEEKVIWAPLWNDALIGRSRSIMCTEFLKTDADVMVIIDDDIVFDSSDFWKIVEGARATKSIYGGAYVTRSTSPFLTSRVFPNTELLFNAGPVRRPIEIQYLATGFFAIHRDLMEAMIDAEFEGADGPHKMAQCQLGADRPFYPFFSPFVVNEGDQGRHYLSEDWAYCNRARQLGFKVWMDQSIILQHMGLYPYTVADLNTPGHAFPSRGIEWAEATSVPIAWGAPLIDDLIVDLAEWAEEDLGDARRMVAAGPAMSAFLFRNKPRIQTEAEWYAREDVGMAYIGDLISWHLRGHVPALDAIERLAGKRVFDFGAGIGTAALLAAEHGADVTVYEPNPVMREFMNWRADKHGLELTMYGGNERPAGLPPQDAVICWHVFEHLHDPEEALDYLLSLLVPGGVLITEDGFEDQDTPQHHAHDDWAAVLASRGLVNVGRGQFVVSEGGGSAGDVAASALNPFPSPSLVGV